MTDADGSHFQLLTFGIGYHGIESDHPPASLVGGGSFLWLENSMITSTSDSAHPQTGRTYPFAILHDQ